MTALDDRTTPDLRADDAFLAIDSAAADRLFREARSANAFDPSRPVSDEQLAALYELAKFGPTAMNTQPLRITYVRTAEGKARLLPHLSPGNQAKSEAAPVVAVLSAARDFHEHLPVTFPHKEGAKEMFDGNEDARWHTATFNATLQAGYFVIAARAAGLTAGPIGGFNADALSAELFPNGDGRAFLIVNLGYPAENAWFDRLPRLNHHEVATFI